MTTMSNSFQASVKLQLCGLLLLLLSGGNRSVLKENGGARSPSPQSKPSLSEAISQLTSACESNDQLACVRLGTSYFVGRDIGVDVNRAIELWSSACITKIPSACGRLANAYAWGYGVVPNRSKALSFYAKACDAGSGTDCVTLAGALDDGAEGVPQGLRDAASLYERAATHFRTACNNGAHAQCGELGLLHEQGLISQKNLEEAEELFGKGCNGGDVNSCFGRDRVAGSGPRKGPPSKQDAQSSESVSSAQDRCSTGNNRVCVELGDVFWRGLIVEQDLDYAAKLFSIACDRDEQEACFRLDALSAEQASGSAYFPIDNDNAMPLFGDTSWARPEICRAYKTVASQSRSIGQELRCSDGSRLSWKSSQILNGQRRDLLEEQLVVDSRGFAEGRSPDEGATQRKSVIGREIACTAGERAGRCRTLARGEQALLLGFVSDGKSPVSFRCFWDGNVMKLPAACRNVISLGEVIAVLDEGVRRSVEQLETACKTGSGESCYELGFRFGNGDGVGRDLSMARKWIKQACEGGHREACDLLPTMAGE